MADKIFAAIDVGSFELAMKIYEISGKSGLKEIDHIRHRLPLGRDSYNTGKISFSKIEELCRVLREFDTIMKSYKVSDYKAYGTSAIRETANTMIVIDEIKNRTGIEIEVLSNSEQRFLDYKSIASKGQDFHKIIESGTAIVDIGGGNIQLSLFENDTLVSTQAIKLGVLRLYDLLQVMRARPTQYEAVLGDMIDGQLSVFRKLYMKDRQINNLIIMDEYVSTVVNRTSIASKNGTIDAKDFIEFASRLFNVSDDEIAEELSVSDESIPMLKISATIIRHMVELCDASLIWAPGVTICDGIAYEYAEKCKLKILAHDFDKDILACATNISKRYLGSKKRSEAIGVIALEIFDAMKKVHGMGKRERFLLSLATILHDCGKFINMTNVGECSYSIIMNTEIIGLSHQEREIVAYVVRFNHDPFMYYEEIAADSIMDKSAYLTIAKLTAILRIAGGLDKSHKQKFKKVKAELKDDKLIIALSGAENVLYEMNSFNKKSSFFGEVYSIEPVVVYKKEGQD